MRIPLKILVAVTLLFGSAAAIRPSPAAAETDRDYYFDRFRSAQPHHGGYYRGPAYGSTYYGRRGYYARRGYHASRCVLERRRVFDRYSRPVWRRVEVCY